MSLSWTQTAPLRGGGSAKLAMPGNGEKKSQTSGTATMYNRTVRVPVITVVAGRLWTTISKQVPSAVDVFNCAERCWYHPETMLSHSPSVHISKSMFTHHRIFAALQTSLPVQTIIHDSASALDPYTKMVRNSVHRHSTFGPVSKVAHGTSR